MRRGMFAIVAGAPALAVLLFLGGCWGERRVDDGDIRPITLDRVVELHERQNREPHKKRLILLDARSQSAYDAGHIAGAEHVQISDINPDLGRDPRIESFDNIVVYADNPGSAAGKGLAKRMMRIRYGDVYLFPGGLDAWRAAGLPIESAE